MNYAEEMNINVVNDFAMNEPVIAQFSWMNIGAVAYMSDTNLDSLIKRVKPSDDSIVAIWKVKRKVNDAYFEEAKNFVRAVAKEYRH